MSWPTDSDHFRCLLAAPGAPARPFRRSVPSGATRPRPEFREFHFEILPWLKERTISRNYPLRESTKTFVKVLRNFPLSKPQNRANRRRKGPLRREIRQLARSHGLTCPWPPHTTVSTHHMLRPMHDIFLFSPVFFVRDFFCRKMRCAGQKVHHEPASSCSPTRISREIFEISP